MENLNSITSGKRMPNILVANLDSLNQMIRKMMSMNKAVQVEINLTVTLTKLIPILEKEVEKKVLKQTKRNLRKISKLKKQKMKQRRI